ncbi:hypothetical protein DUNSADRAFT_16048 [Dunaliella salina]|uniref:Encoded protein n=1 Tax=Dunaliella salina TaxID=3046 RepID=A0ABQ7G4C7_DUNSA|nr:hypothetical protein DUNSADRAFT_16048 [Dunaliella salina]|eukprot:KAF5829467.1 hypothetical protein DUNSADRAFT_16048 [Dunaliella salina]
MASGVAGFGFFTAAIALAVALILHRLSKAPTPAPGPKSGPPPPPDQEPSYLPALEPPSPPSETEDTGHVEQQHSGMLPSSEDLDEEGYRSEVGEGHKGGRGIWSAASSRSPEEAGNEGEITAEAPCEAPEASGDHGGGDSRGQAGKKDA